MQKNPMAEADIDGGLTLFIANPNETRYSIIGTEMQIVNVELMPGKG